jgi:glycosyltransferase involved in cell wall biosynthesis
MAANKLSILLLARSLEVGGAERQLVLLAKGLKERGHSVEVALFYGGGSLVAELHDCGIEVVDLRKKGRWDLLGFMMRVIRELRRRRPDVVYSFLGGANLVAAAARVFSPRTRLVWSIRASNMDLMHYDRLHRIGYTIECGLSGLPDRIIANSSAGAAFAIRNGFPEAKVAIVPNGIDTDRFRPDPALRARQRRLFGLMDGQVAIGVLARLDPQKGHADFLRAASIAAAMDSTLRFLCIGSGPELERLENFAGELGLSGRIIFTGDQDPVAALNALDIACSCSVWGEGFSNSLAEAMACGLPCVVTDVGDSAQIVGPTASLVPPGSPEALAAELLRQAASLDRHDQAHPRARIVESFSSSAMVERTLDVLRSVVAS